jgi:hypothetical protein
VNLDNVLFPESPVSKIPALIEADSSRVAASFEYNQDFIEIVKSLGYEWKGRSTGWVKKITSMTGSSEDRAAELANRLLTSGFPVEIENPEIRRKAVEGDFVPEHTRWILKIVGGKYEGWFSLRWFERNEKLYRMARSLPSSRWSGGSVIVRSEFYAELEDFAQIFEFKFAPEAQKMLDEIREKMETIQKVKVVKVEKPKHRNSVSDILDSDSEVLDDLKD